MKDPMDDWLARQGPGAMQAEIERLRAEGQRMADKTAPVRIWLQTDGSYEDAHEATIGTDTGVTWCDMPQNEGDQEYVRADLLAETQAEIDRLRGEDER